MSCGLKSHLFTILRLRKSLIQEFFAIDSGIFRFFWRKFSRIGTFSRLSPSNPLKDVNIPEDKLTIQSVLAGNREAFGALVSKYQDRLYHSLLCMLGNPDDALELTQDAFVQALVNLDKFRGESGFYTWLYRIAINMASSLKRKRVLVSYDELAENAAFNPPDSGDSPERELEVKENQRLVWEAIGKVAPDFRQVLILREIEGMDYEQIALVLKIKIGTVRSRLYRARLQLAEFLSDK